MGAIEDLRRAVKTEVLDYQQLMDCLRGYIKPRDKVRLMLRSGELVRVKKGLYVFGTDYRRGPWSREVLANLMYGPSYVSLEYALSYYGFIPERVEVVTSVTSERSRRFETPLGVFTYRTMSLRKYSIGIAQERTEPNQHFFIAAPAKALADKVWTDSRFTPRRAADFDAYLHEDLRVEEAALAKIDRALLDLIVKQYGSRKVRLLRDFLFPSAGVPS